MGKYDFRPKEFDESVDPERPSDTTETADTGHYRSGPYGDSGSRPYGTSLKAQDHEIFVEDPADGPMIVLNLGSDEGSGFVDKIMNFPLTEFGQGKDLREIRTAGEYISDSFSLPYGGCIMEALLDVGEFSNTGKRTYFYGNLTGAGGGGEDYISMVKKVNNMTGKIYGAVNAGRGRSAVEEGNIGCLPYVPDIIIWYFKNLERTSPNRNVTKDQLTFLDSILLRCGTSSPQWDRMIKESAQVITDEYARTPKSGRKKGKSAKAVIRGWKRWFNSNFNIKSKGGGSESLRGFIEKNSQTTHDRIMLLKPGYLSALIYKHNLSQVSEERRNRIIRMDKMSSDYDVSTNLYKIADNNEKTTNFFDGIMKKYADDFSDSYFKDAVEGLSEEYTGAYYAGLKSMHNEKPEAGELDYSSHYNVHDETGAELIGAAHPKSINLADAMGNGGVVENAIESGNRMAEIARNTPSGNYRSKHANIVERLNKLAMLAGLSGNRKSMKKIKNAIRKINKE